MQACQSVQVPVLNFNFKPWSRIRVKFAVSLHDLFVFYERNDFVVTEFLMIT
jgi:hypothetical protein